MQRIRPQKRRRLKRADGGEGEELEPLSCEAQAQDELLFSTVRLSGGSVGLVTEAFTGLESKGTVYGVQCRGMQFLTAEEARRGVVPGPKAALKFCLEAELPEGGGTFGESHVLEAGGENGKSWGHWRWFARLHLRADGTALGQFLDLCSDYDGSGHGHRSCLRAKYMAYPTGMLCLYDPRDLDDADKEWLKARRAHGFELTRREVRGCQLSASCTVGDGSELERVQAARGMAKTRYHCTAFHTFGWFTAIGGSDERFEARHALEIAEWAEARRVLSVRISRVAEELRIACTRLSGCEECSFSLDSKARVAELRAEVELRAGKVRLAMADGRFLGELEDDTALVSLS